MARSESRTPGHGQADPPQRASSPYGNGRDRSHLAEPPRRPNGPPKAAGGPKGRRVLEMTISLAGLEGLRTKVAAWMNRLGAARVRDDVVLVTHELATNVIRHGGGFGRLRMWRESGRIVCRVSDSGPGMPALVQEVGEAEEPETRRPGGRGLWIARRLADVRIESGPSGTVVVAAMTV
jgi:anti-sigma regulatory factor (Ser/Thr protein kinase)